MKFVLAPESIRASACDFLPNTHSVTGNINEDLLGAIDLCTLSWPNGVSNSMSFASWTQTTIGSGDKNPAGSWRLYRLTS